MPRLGVDPATEDVAKTRRNNVTFSSLTRGIDPPVAAKKHFLREVVFRETDRKPTHIPPRQTKNGFKREVLYSPSANWAIA